MTTNPLTEHIAQGLLKWVEAHPHVAAFPFQVSDFSSLAADLAQALAPKTTEAQVEAEAKRIWEWVKALPSVPYLSPSADIPNLAAYLVAYRITVQDAKAKALRDACEAALAFMVEWDISQHVVSGLSLQLHAALKPWKEAP